MTTITFLDRGTLAPQIKIHSPTFEHDWEEWERTEPGEVVERLQGTEIAILNKVRITQEHLDALPELRMIAIAATGSDNVDLAACAAKGVTVSNIRAYAVNTVPEHTFAMILALRRGLLPYREAIVGGRWQEVGQFCFFDHRVHDLAGSTLGIIGEGAIGQAVAAIGRAFGMRILFAAHKGVEGLGPLYTPFDKVMADSDVLTLHCPLTVATRNLLSDREFDLMARRPVVVNTARGGLIDELALARALRDGRISGAGMDVATEEPPAQDHPLMQLLDHTNFLFTPHTAWASTEAMQSLADQLISNVEAFVKGHPRNVVIEFKK
jgi:glycerate dehydrogenase